MRTLTRHGHHVKSSCPPSSSSSSPLNEGLFALSVGPKGSKLAQNGLVSPFVPFHRLFIPNGLGWSLEKCVVHHFSPTFGPKLAHFKGISGISRGKNKPPWGEHGLTPLVLASHVVRDRFWGRAFFSPRWTRSTYLGTHPPQTGDSNGWKPHKVEGCGWSQHPWNVILSHDAQGMVCPWSRAVGVQNEAENGLCFGAKLPIARCQGLQYGSTMALSYPIDVPLVVKNQWLRLQT